MREEFEAWWPSVGQTIGKAAAWEAWQAARATPEPIGDPTEEMLLAGIAAANRQMPYINDTQKVLAIWNSMQARATPALPPALPQGVEECQCCGYAGQDIQKYRELLQSAAILAGMAIVPVEPTEAMLEAITEGFPSSRLSYKYMLAAAKEKGDA